MTTIASTHLPAAAAAAFALRGAVLDVRLHGRGLIHDTYLVTTDDATTPHAILQRINRRAFAQPELIMENLRTLLDHVAGRATGQDGLRFPALYATRDGTDLYTDAEDGCWRAMSYIENTRSYHRPETPRHAEQAGSVLGRFHALVGDLDPMRMHDTRPDFHHTPRHIERLERIAAANPQRRDREVDGWMEFIAARRNGADAIEAGLARGTIARRVVHGDPKLDNVLFDTGSDEAVSLIDLDTVKPGTVHHDIADCLRSCCNRSGETADDANAVRYDLDMCRAGLAGYFAAAGEQARALRVDELYAAIRLIPFELGVRFLADHLDGDRYFRIEREGQNLVRAGTQFRLSADIERQRAAIENMIAALAPGG